MSSYRLYFLDDAGHFQRSQDLECENDEKAIDMAAAAEHLFGMELWSRSRLVWRFAERVVFKDLIAQRLGPTTRNAQGTSELPGHHPQLRNWLNRLLGQT